MEKTIKVSEVTYRLIKSLAKKERRTIKGITELMAEKYKK